MTLRFVIRFHSMKKQVVPMARPVSCLFLEQGSLLCVTPHNWGSQGMLSSGVGISSSGGFFCSRAVGRHLQSSYSSCSRLLYLLPSCFLTPNRPCTLCWYGAVAQMETALASIKPRGLPWGCTTERFCGLQVVHGGAYL